MFLLCSLICCSSEFDRVNPTIEPFTPSSGSSSTNIHWLEQPTNGCAYVTGVIDCLNVVPDDMKPYVPLFTSYLAR